MLRLAREPNLIGLQALSRLRALRSDHIDIDPTIAVHNGRVVKRTGDGSIVEFRTRRDDGRFRVSER